MGVEVLGIFLELVQRSKARLGCRVPQDLGMLLGTMAWITS